MLHKQRVLKTICYSTRRRLRQWVLRKGPRPAPPQVLSQPLDAVVERHSWIARTALDNLPAGLDLKGKHVCEVGPGDCLAAASLFLGLGAARVEMVETSAPVVNEKQLQVLERLKAEGFPVDLSIIVNDGAAWKLDPSRIGYHQVYMENFSTPQQMDFMFSFSVMEHVEDLPGFYRSAARVMAPKSWMVHAVDLGGHELFDEPLPPLDFQTYSEALYRLMYPIYRRATRRFLDEHLDAAEAGGFAVKRVNVTRRADDAYLNSLWPNLRPEARLRSRETLSAVEFTFTAQKKD